MGRPKTLQPAYQCHKATGQAKVRIDGKDHYLGPHGSPKSLEKYNRLLAERSSEGGNRTIARPTDDVMLIAELIVLYGDHAKQKYGATSEVHHTIRRGHDTLKIVYGSLPINEFTPKKLKAVRERLIDYGDLRSAEFDDDERTMLRKPGKPLTRSYVNKVVSHIKYMFHWAVTEDLLDVNCHLALAAVPDLHKGESKKAKEPRKVRPAPDDAIEAVKAAVSEEVAAMIDIQLLTGMRPDEVTIMRPCDIDRSSGDLWLYTIKSRHDGGQGYKTDGVDGEDEKTVLIGPKAQSLLQPWIDRTERDDYLFSPRRVIERYIREKRAKNGKDPNVVKLQEKHPARDRYDDETYARAVTRACKKAGVSRWTPNQLRHNAGTRIRSVHGLEGSKLYLGHRHISTTEIYAEQDQEKYRAITKSMG